MTLDNLRSHFPVLQRRIEGKPLIYLDSAATALKPQGVLDAEKAYLTEYTANVHRGRHLLSEEASAAFEHARQTVARFIGAAPSNVVFVGNATQGVNWVESGLRHLPGLRVAPVGEHHSNLVPWMKGGAFQFLRHSPLHPIDPAWLAKELDRLQPSLLALGWASNVTGVIQPVAELCQVARERGILTLVDAAQSVAHLPIRVEEIGCDFLVFSGHKVMGPTGIGVLYGREDALSQLQPVFVGGGTVNKVSLTGYELKKPPFCFEAGTPHISGAIGLAQALDFLEGLGWQEIERHEARLASALEESLRPLKKATVLMGPASSRLAIASVVPHSTHISPDTLALVLSDSHGVMVRSGYHCAQPLFEHLEFKSGALRASAYVYNTVEEVTHFGQTLVELVEQFLGTS